MSKRTCENAQRFLHPTLLRTAQLSARLQAARKEVDLVSGELSEARQMFRAAEVLAAEYPYLDSDGGCDAAERRLACIVALRALGAIGSETLAKALSRLDDLRLKEAEIERSHTTALEATQ